MAGESPLRKKPRLSRDEARAAVLEAGQRLLVERGLDIGLGLVSLHDAIAESGVPRASAYRAFVHAELDPQMAFRTELLLSYVDRDPLQVRRNVAALEVSGEIAERLDTDDPVELATVMREAIRVSFAGLVAPLWDDPDWKVVGPSWATTALTDWAPDELVDAHRAGMQAAAFASIPLYQAATARCGLRLRDHLDWEAYSLLAFSTAVSGSFFQRYHPELQRIMRPTGPDGELQAWSQAAILVEGLTLTSFEPDPDAAVSADLSSWT